MKAAATLCMLMVLPSPFSASASYAKSCGKDISEAISKAKLEVERDSPASDREALVCLVEAVEQLSSRLDGIVDGSIPFSGQVYAPSGLVMNKPSDQGER